MEVFILKKVILFSVGLMSLAAPIVSRAADNKNDSQKEITVFRKEKKALEGGGFVKNPMKGELSSYKVQIGLKGDKKIPIEDIPGYIAIGKPKRVNNDGTEYELEFKKVSENQSHLSTNSQQSDSQNLINQKEKIDFSNLGLQPDPADRIKAKEVAPVQPYIDKSNSEKIKAPQESKESLSAEPKNEKSRQQSSTKSDSSTQAELSSSKQLNHSESFQEDSQDKVLGSEERESNELDVHVAHEKHQKHVDHLNYLNQRKKQVVAKKDADSTSAQVQLPIAKTIGKGQNKVVSKTNMIKIQGLDENGNDLFLRVIDRSKVADIFHENIEFYGYEWQSTSYDKQKDLYLLQYQRNDVTVTIVNVDENGHQLSKSTLSGKFGEKLHYVPISIDGYRSIITDKQITLSTMTPANVKINYVKDNDKKMDLQVNHSELPVTNKERSLENTPKDVFEDTKNQNVVLNDQGVSKEVNDKAEDKKQNNQVTQKTGRSTRGRSKNKHVVLSKKATDPKSSAQQVSESSNSETTRSSKAGRSSNRLPQTGDADSKRGIIIGLGLLISLLAPKLKKWI